MRTFSPREEALDLLLAVLKEGAYSPLVLHAALENSRADSRDRSLTTALVYGVLQRKLTLDYVLHALLGPGKKIEDWVRVLLWISIYQKLYMDRIPDHAVVNEAVNLAKRRGHQGIAGLVNGVLRRFLREGKPDLETIQPKLRRQSIRSSHPEWLLRLWSEQWSNAAALEIAEADNRAPQTSVRVNRRRTDVDGLIQKLSEEGIDATRGKLSADSLVLSNGNAAASSAFRRGFMTVQDQSSMLIADAVCMKPSLRLLDACAGPGGKTTHLAERSDDQGDITALDLYPHKAELIDRAAARLGLKSIATRACDAREASAVFQAASFDRVLLDVPCSGLGVLRRKPEIRWRKSADDLAALVRVQRDILEATADLVCHGGLLIYSTCTINRDENDRQVEQFMERHPQFSWDDTLWERLPRALAEKRVAPAMVQIMPQDYDTDGFFIAVLRRA
ncbi:MAG: 16S rRNA (cytosine(967)-C(5))-methyltransferase RsmB [Sporolactobacillus sp.]